MYREKLWAKKLPESIIGKGGNNYTTLYETILGI